MWYCAWQLDFLKYLCHKNGPKIGFFDFIGKFRHQFFLNFNYNENLFYLLNSYANPIFGRKSGSWDMGQNARPICKIFKSPISLKQGDEKFWFFACWYKFIKIKSRLKYIGEIRGQKWVYPLWGHSTLKLAVSQEGI